MKERGFTLVELLAVIIVIGLIASFALPQVLTQFSNNTGELSKQQEELLLESAYAYILENESQYKGKGGCITVKDLVSANALDSKFAEQVYSSYQTSKDGVKYWYNGDTLKVGLGTCQ